MGITPAILGPAWKTPFETDSLNSEAKIGESMSTICLKAEEGISFKGDFFGSHERITFLTSTNSVKKKYFATYYFFSIGFLDEGGILLARVMATEEK